MNAQQQTQSAGTKRSPQSLHRFAPDPLAPLECKWCGRRERAHPSK